LGPDRVPLTALRLGTGGVPLTALRRPAAGGLTACGLRPRAVACGWELQRLTVCGA
jgi:hypothetical protein